MACLLCICFVWFNLFPGILGIVWFAFWVLLIYDSPTKHPRISQEEREYIVKSIGPKQMVRNSVNAEDSSIGYRYSIMRDETKENKTDFKVSRSFKMLTLKDPHHQFICLYFPVQNSFQNMWDFSAIKRLVASTLVLI